jgi:hypothetical protein
MHSRRLGLLALLLPFLACSEQQPGSGQAARRSDLHVVSVAGKAIELPTATWKAMRNEFEWAENFEQVTKEPKHLFPRVVTVFKLPMTDDRRSGIRISPREYVEMFVVDPGTLTVQIRVDKGTYWVLSRETFAAGSIYGVDTGTAQHSLYDEEFKSAQQSFGPEIDRTRYLLQSTF